MTLARLVSQIFRKDIERLWPAVLLTLVLLAVFVWQDATRSVSVWSASSQGYGWLNLALPFAWSFLIALVINQDPLAGDRQFWVSLPCGWRPLLAAKTAFIATSIQVPYFLATAAILIARGFNPLQHIPHLLWKQIVLLVFILPALAVAVVVKNIAHFLLVVITVAGCIVIMSNRFNLYAQDTSWDVRWNLAVLVLGASALVVTTLQFARRDTLRARTLGIAAAVAAFGLYNWLSRDASAAIRAAISPAHLSAPASVTLGSGVPGVSEQKRYYNNRRTTILIPIQVSGLGSNAKLDQIGLELTDSSGNRYEAQWPRSSNDIRSERITAGLDMFYANRPSVQWLEIGSAEISKRVLSGKVTIHGRILARFYQPGPSTTLHPVGRTDVPVLGYCLVTNPAEGGTPMAQPRTMSASRPKLLPTRCL